MMLTLGGLYRYKLMWAITSVNSDADARYGQDLRRRNPKRTVIFNTFFTYSKFPIVYII